MAALLLLLNGCGSADHVVLKEVVERVYTVDPSTNITIHNQDGAILVYGSDVDEVRVRSLKKAYSQERLNEMAIDVSVQPRAISVTAKVPPRPKWVFRDHSGTVDFTIVAPATASISALDLNAGEVLLDSMAGRELRARLGHGRIFVRNCFTNVDLVINHGTLTLGYDWWEQGKFLAQVNVRQGNAWVFLPTDASFHLLARAAYGKIVNDFNSVPLSANSSARGMKIDQIVNGGVSAIMQIQVEQGDIKIAEANP